MVRSAQTLAICLATTCSYRSVAVLGFRTLATRRVLLAGSNNYNYMASINTGKASMSMSMSTSTITSNLQEVRNNIQQQSSSNTVRLVAVSKTKSNDAILEAYEAGQRIFGENYVQELVDKAMSLPSDITWHFIGPLQSNKAKLLVTSVLPNAAGLVIETVATLKLAKKLQSAMEELSRDDSPSTKLNIFIQINTSGEDTKSGVAPNDVLELCRLIIQECPKLHIQGLMTIGAPGDLTCFDTLRQCRDETVATLELSSLELSMGMSDDYVQAIAHGSTNVRVGSTIFGVRNYPNK